MNFSVMDSTKLERYQGREAEFSTYWEKQLGKAMARIEKKPKPLRSKQVRCLIDRKPRDERWQELLAAAAEVFYEKGYDGATLQDIADRVGILKGSIYYYIETKTDLRNNLLLQVHSEGLLAIRKSANVEGDALNKLETMIRGHVDYICRNLAKTTIYLRELSRLTAAERTELLGPQNYRDVFLEIIELGQREGTILEGLDPKLTAQTMISSLNSIYHWYRPRPGQSGRVIANHFVTILLRGHGTPQALRAHALKMFETGEVY